MAYLVATEFKEEQRKIEGTKPINMYILNASPSGFDPLYYANINQDVIGFEMNATGDLVATTVTYTGIPIKQGEIQNSIQGDISTVSVSIPNVDRVIESVIQNNNYLRGQEVYFLTAFCKYLPASNISASYIGETPDRHAIMKEKLYIDSTNSDDQVVTFQVKPKFVLKNIVLPRRRFTQTCSCEYNSTECGVSATVFASYPTCDYTLENCRSRENNTRFGGFTSIPKRGFVVI